MAVATLPPPDAAQTWSMPPPSEPRSITTVTPVAPEHGAAVAGTAVPARIPTLAAAVVTTTAARRASW